ncbi:FadR/GntR family transcriptional regulator [Pseudarthrobacter niigatensis]|uniref:FadR/GntR family transcriptional regulator n=1 Tax=Pseudarthrobacter niigatensis TaxID=369935 RepID=UPI0027D914B2|nr:FCD domain-containing protein [Pseudarthrobacter niigatensis]
MDSLISEASNEESTGRLRLPTERALGASLDLSRGMLREQLATLELLGFLDRTQGRGTYLEAPDSGFIQLYFRLALRLGHIGAEQFTQAREMLEMAVVEQAAMLATKADVATLRSHVDRMVESTSRGDVDKAIAADYDFHRSLFELVNNPIFNFLHDGLRDVLRDVVGDRRRQALAVVESTKDFITDRVHYEITDALATNDPEAARHAMHRHFDVWRTMTDKP